MPLWLLLLIFAGGAAAVTTAAVASSGSSSSPSCTVNKLEPPKTNTVFSNGDIDFAAFGDSIRGLAKKTRDTQRRALEGVGVAVATAFPVAAPYVAAVVGAVEAAMSAYDSWFNSEARNNTKEWQDKYTTARHTWVDRGYIPPAKSTEEGATFKADWENLDRAIMHIDSREPYVQWLYDASGFMFKKWGTHDRMLLLTAQFLTKGTAETYGTIPWGNETDIGPNTARLRLVSMAIALEYGVQDRFEDLFAYVMATANNWPELLKWKNDDPDWGWADPAGRWTAQEMAAVLAPVYHYAVGVWAAFTKAAEMACVAGPPGLSKDEMMQRPADSSPFIQQQPLSAPAAAPAANVAAHGSMLGWRRAPIRRW